MTVKEDLKTFIKERLTEKASPLFLKRALDSLELAEDKESLRSAVERGCRMISLFIDTELAQEMSETLKTRLVKKN